MRYLVPLLLLTGCAHGYSRLTDLGQGFQRVSYFGTSIWMDTNDTAERAREKAREVCSEEGSMLVEMNLVSDYYATKAPDKYVCSGQSEGRINAFGNIESSGSATCSNVGGYNMYRPLTILDFTCATRKPSSP